MKQIIYNQKINLGKEFHLDKETSHHVKNVLRLKLQDKIYVIDESENLYFSQIVKFIHNIVYLIPLKKIEVDKSENINIDLFFSIIKKNKINILLEKCTELGVNSFNPIITEHCSISKKDLNNINLKRWQKIIKSSVQQCGRSTIPKINKIIDITKLNFDNDDKSIFLLLDENEANPILSILMKTDFEIINNINIFVGPEGSFSDYERDYLIKNFDAIPVSISKNILRSETASVFSIGVCRHFIEAFFSKF